MKKLHSIVVAIDIHDNYAPILEYAKELASKHQAKLAAIHVLPQSLSSMPYAYDFQVEIEKEVTVDLKKIEKETDYAKFKTVLACGSPKDEVIACAEREQAELIISGSHGKHGLELILGSVANGILHKAKCDVLTLRVNKDGQLAPSSKSHKNIVVATDLHEDSHAVIDAAFDIAKDSDANIFLIHTVTDLPAMYNVHMPSIGLELEKNAQTAMQKVVAKYKISANHSKIIIGHPKTEVLNYADEVNADLIVIGSHGRSGLAAAFLGSTANAVLHGARVDTYVVRV